MSKSEASAGRLAVILVRGRMSMRKDLLATLDHMKLYKKHACAILPDTESTRGMCKKVNGFVAWGEVNAASIAALSKSNSKNTPPHHLAPPRKGFPRKGIKTGFGEGGALGYWGPKINDLIARMIP